MPPELRAYLTAMRWVRWAGLPDRAPPQTPGEHHLVLQSVAPGVALAMAPVRSALERAIYSDARERRAGHWRVATAALWHRLGAGG